LDEITLWSQVRDRFQVKLTQSVDEASNFLCDGISPAESFPEDRLWIAPTNRLAAEISQRIQAWRSSNPCDLGILRALTQLITPCKTNPGLNEAHQIDFIEKLDTPDLPPHISHFYEGDLCILLRNISTASGLVKGRRCWIVNANRRVVVIRLDTGEEITLPRIPMEKVSNGMKFARWQVPLKLIFAGTVHRSQGMTLTKVVIDLRSGFWEHGQLYVALSRVRNPANMCILLPDSSDEISPIDRWDVPLHVPVNPEVVDIVSNIASNEVMDGQEIPIICPIEESPIELSQVADDFNDQNPDVSESLSIVLSIQACPDEADIEHINGDDVATQEPILSVDDQNEIDLAVEEIDSDSDDDNVLSDMLSDVDMKVLYAKTVTRAHSILVSRFDEEVPNTHFMSCLNRIRVMMAKFLIVYRTSQFSIAIGNGLPNGRNICYLISVIQMFYHMEDVRRPLSQVSDKTDSAFELGKLLFIMERGQICSRSQLQRNLRSQLQTIETSLGFVGSSDAAEAALKLLELMMCSKDSAVVDVMQKLLCFNEITVEVDNHNNVRN
jgi:hypothetical protein